MRPLKTLCMLALFFNNPLTALGEELAPRTGDPANPAQSIIKPQRKPVFIEADRIHGYYKQEMEATGNAELRHGNNKLTADRMKYFQATEDTEVEGNVKLERSTDTLKGNSLQINLLTEVGHMSEPRYYMKERNGRGAGSLLLFEGKDHYRLKDGSYTTCPEGNEDWYIRAGDLAIDNKKEVGTARNVTVVFKDKPILYVPWINFSYGGQRKTGMLAPIMGNTAKTGFEIALPFYLNIAPNIDATIAPRLMSKRGLMINNELRYMGNNLSGNAIFDILPNDIKTQQTRYGISFEHTQYLGRGWQGNLDYNHVSDDRFFRDLTNDLSQTSKTNLSQRAALSYHGALGENGSISFTGLVQGYQTLQDPFARIYSPYIRLPQFTLDATKQNVAGFMDFNFSSSWSNFYHAGSTLLNGKPLVDGKRLVLYPSVSIPLRNEFGFIIPKFGVHYTQYDLSAPIGPKGEKTPDRTVPIFSLDSGVVFERNTTLSDRKFVQTLEPRLFYVYAPHRNQNHLPIFDSAINDFSFAQMLTENRFSGSDRINDANQVTMALTSRFVESETGIERLRVAVGQQVRFSEYRVDPAILTADPADPRNLKTFQQATSGKSDFIAAVSGRLTQHISTDTNIQVDDNRLWAEKIRTGLSYQPEAGKVVNIGYRFSRDILEQVDASTQWPIMGNWHGVARANYSLKDDKFLAGLAGLEYNSCCWALRVVLQRLTTATHSTSTAFFVQLELKGLMGIGNNPMRVLQSIPGYTSIH